MPDILGFATDISAGQLVSLINQKRAEEGLPLLNLDPELSQAAVGKAQDMFVKDYWAHNSPDGLTPWIFIRNAGYNYLYAGENLAKNFANSEGVVNAWMASPSHRANILKSEYQDVGFAVVNGRLGGEETTLVVQLFGARQKAAIAAKPPPTSLKPTPTVSSPMTTLTPTPPLALAPAIHEPAATAVARFSLPPATFTSVKNRPLLNPFSLTKNTALFLVSFLILVLSLDALLIWRRKTVRFSGHNLAHIFFLTAVVGAIWLTQQGAIR